MYPDIKQVACVGTGLVGQSWASLFAIHGYNVVIMDMTNEKLNMAVSRIEKQIEFLVKSGLVESNDGILERINTTTSVKEALSEANYVQESVFESYEVKKTVFAEIDEVATADTIIASSTSGLLMTNIQKAASHHPERCITAHPWNPPHLVPLVEISPGQLTSEATIRRTYTLMKSIRKVPIILKKEAPGLIANRMAVALWREALNIVDEGIASVEDVDTAVRAGPGLRWAIMGPYLTYHLGGGEGGFEYLMRHIASSNKPWLESLAKWTIYPESAVKKAIKGVSEMKVIKENSMKELESWRDQQLVELLKLLGLADTGT